MHDRCGIDFVRWKGTERKSRAELNITKRFRVEAPLGVLLERAFEAVGGAVVQVTLRNEPIYDGATPEWLSKFEAVELSGDPSSQSLDDGRVVDQAGQARLG